MHALGGVISTHSSLSVIGCVYRQGMPGECSLPEVNHVLRLAFEIIIQNTKMKVLRYQIIFDTLDATMTNIRTFLLLKTACAALQ